MEVVLPLVVCVLAVSAAPNLTRLRRPDETFEDPLLAEDDDDLAPNFDYYEEDRINISEKGRYLGSPCEFTCNPKLSHVYCDPKTLQCTCDSKHPVVLSVTRGCAKPKKLGEQCFYVQTCRAFDSHASCIQNNHNAFCQCEPGYHRTSHSRPTQRVFCTEADMPTLLGVASGIFVLAGLLCMVLHLYTKARFHPTHLADARLTPPCIYALNKTGRHTGGAASAASAVSAASGASATRASSRASSRSGCTSNTLEESTGSRRTSRRGVPVSASRAGSRRPSLSSVQSSSSSIRSYSAKKWEREREQKERRQMSMRLAQLHEKMASGREMPKLAPSPPPRSPNNSTDGLLPAVSEVKETTETEVQGVEGPCSSQTLY